MVLCCTKTHKIEKVFLVIESHMDSKLLENVDESLVADEIISPVVKLALALEAETIKDLWLDIVSF